MCSHADLLTRCCHCCWSCRQLYLRHADGLRSQVVVSLQPSLSDINVAGASRHLLTRSGHTVGVARLRRGALWASSCTVSHRPPGARLSEPWEASVVVYVVCPSPHPFAPLAAQLLCSSTLAACLPDTAHLPVVAAPAHGTPGGDAHIDAIAHLFPI